MLLLRLQWSLVAFILFIILVDLGNKLGIGQDKDASRSSRQFADIYLLFLDNLAHSRLDFFCCTLNFNFSINCLFLFIVHAQIRNGRIDSNQILHFDSP